MNDKVTHLRGVNNKINVILAFALRNSKEWIEPKKPSRIPRKVAKHASVLTTCDRGKTDVKTADDSLDKLDKYCVHLVYLESILNSR